MFSITLPAQDKSRFLVRLIKDTEEGVPITNLNLASQLPVVLTAHHKGDGIYEIVVNRKVGVPVQIRFIPDRFVFVVPNKGVVITDPDVDPVKYLVCNKKDIKKCLETYLRKSLQAKATSFNEAFDQGAELRREKQAFLDGGGGYDPDEDSRLKYGIGINELITQSRLDILEKRKNRSLVQANESFLAGDFLSARKQLLMNSDVIEYNKSPDSKVYSRATITDKITLLADTYVMDGHMDSALYYYTGISSLNKTPSIITIFKTINLLMTMRRFEEAYTCLLKAASFKPRNTNEKSLVLLARVYLNGSLFDNETFPMELDDDTRFLYKADNALTLGTILSLIRIVVEDKMDQDYKIIEPLLRPVWQSSYDEYKLTAIDLVRKVSDDLTTGQADSLFQVIISQIRSEADTSNSSFNKAILKTAELYQLIIRAEKDPPDTVTMNTNFQMIKNEFLQHPNLRSETLLYEVFYSYYESVLPEITRLKTKEKSDLEKFYLSNIEEIRSVTSRYNPSFLLSELNYFLSLYYAENKSIDKSLIAFREAISFGLNSSSARGSKQLLLILKEEDLNDACNKNTTCKIELDALFRQYLKETPVTDPNVPILMETYAIEYDVEDEDLLSSILSVYLHQASTRATSYDYIDSYTRFAPYAIDIMLEGKKLGQYGELFKLNNALLWQLTKRKFSSDYFYDYIMRDYITYGIDPELTYLLSAKGSLAASQYLDSTITRFLNLAPADSTYAFIAKHLLEFSIPDFLKEVSGDRDLPRIWLKKMEEFYEDPRYAFARYSIDSGRSKILTLIK